MEIITRSAGSSAKEIHVKGTIKGIDDSMKFKEAVSSVFYEDPTANIAIHIEDSNVITSSIIGSLLKLIQQDKARISLNIKSAELISLLEQLNITTLLNAKKN
jgi:hypothetical protein